MSDEEARAVVDEARAETEKIREVRETVEYETAAQTRARRILTGLALGLLVVTVGAVTIGNQIDRNEAAQDREMIHCHTMATATLHIALGERLAERDKQLSWVPDWQVEFEKWQIASDACGSIDDDH